MNIIIKSAKKQDLEIIRITTVNNASSRSQLHANAGDGS